MYALKNEIPISVQKYNPVSHPDMYYYHTGRLFNGEFAHVPVRGSEANIERTRLGISHLWNSTRLGCHSQSNLKYG